MIKIGFKWGTAEHLPVPVRSLLLHRRTADLRVAPADLCGQGHLLARPQARIRPRQRVATKPCGHAARVFAGRK